MRIIPAIDLMGGRCVQLVGGDPATKKDFGDPPKVAEKWRDMGARTLHIIDLDATLGLGENIEAIMALKGAFGGECEIGGGIRTPERANGLLNKLGQEDRIIVGTMIVTEYPDYPSLSGIGSAADRLMVSVDSKGGQVVIKGWQEGSGLDAAKLMQSLDGRVWGYLFTNVDVEGKMEGIDQGAVEDIVSSTESPVIVSGGITSTADIDACESAGAWGIVIGKAIYEGKLDLGGMF